MNYGWIINITNGKEGFVVVEYVVLYEEGLHEEKISHNAKVI